MLNRCHLLALALMALGTDAFPWVASAPGVDASLLKTHDKRQQTYPNGPGSEQNCPFNPVHPGAAPITAQYPYNNAKNGVPGNGKGGFLVPAPGDTAHYYTAPNISTDVRGPCPGLNTAANHNFLSHDGITTFNELVDAQQNLYNVGYDLAVLLAVLGLTITDGDTATERLSIGCDATSRTSINPLLTGSEPGLDGHNKFEADSSLTRNDYFTHNGDNFHFNGTLFGMMTQTTGGNYDLNNLALYRYQRYQQSRAENPNFYFGPLSLLLFGAATFLYELMPSGTRNYAPDIYTISSFFGTEQQSDGSWAFNGEKIPDNWTNRLTPYDIFDVGEQLFEMYALYPVEFGGNAGVGNFVPLNSNGYINGNPNATDGAGYMCLLYQAATERLPSSLNSFVTPTVDTLSFVLSKLSPSYANLGCSLPLS